jgi:hypothetical protein
MEFLGELVSRCSLERSTIEISHVLLLKISFGEFMGSFEAHSMVYLILLRGHIGGVQSN